MKLCNFAFDKIELTAVTFILPQDFLNQLAIIVLHHIRMRWQLVYAHLGTKELQ